MAYMIQSQLDIEALPPAGVDFPAQTISTGFLPRSRSYPLCADLPLTNLVGATDVDLMPAGFTKIEFLMIRVQGGNLAFKVTTAAGTTQVIPCDDVWHFQSMTQPITGLSCSGTAQLSSLYGGE
jgi:hypothetical protein